MAKRLPLNERVKSHVEANGLTVSEVAKKSGWSYLRTLRLLNGDTDITGEDMETFARVLGRDVGELYEARA